MWKINSQKKKNPIDPGFASPRPGNELAGFLLVKALFLVQSAISSGNRELYEWPCGQEVTWNRRLLPQGAIYKANTMKYASISGLMEVRERLTWGSRFLLPSRWEHCIWVCNTLGPRWKENYIVTWKYCSGKVVSAPLLAYLPCPPLHHKSQHLEGLPP